jgi:AcrR family transcriptional regulator
VRTHGWAGRPPLDDDEAVARILVATRACIDTTGASTSIADVARALGVTRQTVYRYFPGTEELLKATALAATDEFVEAIAAHVAQITDPSAAIV